MPNKLITIILIFATICFSVIAINTAPEKNYSSVANSLSIGFVVSAMFYFMVVYLPEKQKRNLIRKSLKRQYRQFKLSCIDIFLIMSKSQRYPNREMLLDQKEFRRYFKNNVSTNQERWDSVANGLQSNQVYLQEIIYELRMLNEEIRFVKSSIDIHDEETFVFFNRLSQIILKIESTQPEYDDVKSFCRFLWELFTGWNLVDGYKDTDFISDMIEKLNKT